MCKNFIDIFCYLECMLILIQIFMSYGSLDKGKAQVKDCQIALNLEEEVVHIAFREMISGTS